MAKKQQIVRRITDGDEEFIVVKPDFIENLAAELEKVKRERDALLETLDHSCETCKNNEACTEDGCCLYCDNNESDATPCCKCIYSCNWEWRGLPEVRDGR